MSYATERAFAEAGYTDLREFAAPPPPVTQAEADRIADALADDMAERMTRVALASAADRADRRRRCTTDHAREVREAATRFAYVLAAAKADGFLTPHRDEIKALMEREVRALQEQQENR